MFQTAQIAVRKCWLQVVTTSQINFSLEYSTGCLSHVMLSVDFCVSGSIRISCRSSSTVVFMVTLKLAKATALIGNRFKQQCPFSPIQICCRKFKDFFAVGVPGSCSAIVMEEWDCSCAICYFELLMHLCHHGHPPF